MWGVQNPDWIPRNYYYDVILVENIDDFRNLIDELKEEGFYWNSNRSTGLERESENERITNMIIEEGDWDYWPGVCVYLVKNQKRITYNTLLLHNLNHTIPPTSYGYKKRNNMLSVKKSTPLPIIR